MYFRNNSAETYTEASRVPVWANNPGNGANTLSSWSSLLADVLLDLFPSTPSRRIRGWIGRMYFRGPDDEDDDDAVVVSINEPGNDVAAAAVVDDDEEEDFSPALEEAAAPEAVDVAIVANSAAVEDGGSMSSFIKSPQTFIMAGSIPAIPSAPTPMAAAPPRRPPVPLPLRALEMPCPSQFIIAKMALAGNCKVEDR